MNSVVLAQDAPVSRAPARTRHTALLTLVGAFGGMAHDLPEMFYMGGIGPFDVLILVLLLRWLLHTPAVVSRRALTAAVPFFLFAVFAYVGDLAGSWYFDLTSWSSIVAPLRFITYPTLFVTLPPLLCGREQFRTLFLAYIAGVLILSVLAVFRSIDPGFFFGLPVLYDPNVVGNFISYAMIALGFGFMSRGLLVRGGLVAALFGFALFTFSKASWLMSIGGLYINAVRVKLWKILSAALFLVGLSFFFVDWAQIYALVTTAIDMKATAAVGTDQEGGSVVMRLSFFVSSIYALFDYPLGVGFKNFWDLNYSYAYVHDYFDSASPHMAFGYSIVQGGWAGLILLGYIYTRVLQALFRLYESPALLTRLALVFMITISMLFQIEFITQPFIYMVLAAALAHGAGAARVRPA